MMPGNRQATARKVPIPAAATRPKDEAGLILFKLADQAGFLLIFPGRGE